MRTVNRKAVERVCSCRPTTPPPAPCTSMAPSPAADTSSTPLPARCTSTIASPAPCTSTTSSLEACTSMTPSPAPCTCSRYQQLVTRLLYSNTYEGRPSRTEEKSNYTHLSHFQLLGWIEPCCCSWSWGPYCYHFYIYCNKSLHNQPCLSQQLELPSIICARSNGRLISDM